MSYQHIEQWTNPQYYSGAQWEGWYRVIAQNRDSDCLERANFDSMLAHLEPLNTDHDDEPTVQRIREGHWACGWVEWIGVHESNTAALELADQLRAKLEDYPILDEDLHSRYENEECSEVWLNCYSERERFDYLRKHIHHWETQFSDESLFVCIRKACRDGQWYYAANMLPCPSDLIY